MFFAKSPYNGPDDYKPFIDWHERTLEGLSVAEARKRIEEYARRTGNEKLVEQFDKFVASNRIERF
jgi:hypothetical protein